MRNLLSYSIVLVKRWAWIVLLGIVLCGGAGYGISKITHPAYQASAILIINLGASTSPYENFNASVQAAPAYAQLLTNYEVLYPVVKRYPGMTVVQLKQTITVNPHIDTPLIELDVQNGDPQLAMNLANEISQSFAQFVNSRLPATVEILPAVLPTQPVGLSRLMTTAIGALVGLGLAIALIIIFEWLDDRPVSSEEVQELLDIEVLAAIPHLSRKERTRRTEEIPAMAEEYRMLSASLNAAQREKSFKMLMVTSTLANEGKSTSAVNLATFLASGGKRVLLVDADLRNPALARHFQFDQLPQGASAFAGMWTGIEGDLYGRPTDVANLHVLTAGALSSNSTHLLQPLWSDQFFAHLKKAPFDYIIFDTPPLLPAADSQVLASYIQAVVLVVDPSKTPRKLLLRAKHLLIRTHNRILGVIINKSPWAEPGEIRQYLQDTRRHRGATRAVFRPPETPPVDGLGDPSDITMVLPRPSAAKEDQEEQSHLNP